MTAKSQAERWQAWNERNPGKATEQARAWRERNPGKTTERVRAWREANPERAKELRQRAREAEKRYRTQNRDRLREYNRIYDREVRQRLIAAEKLRHGACLDCGLVVTVDNLVVFDFDHRDRSTKRSVVSRTAPSRLAEEMAKCDLRCANCHRLKTWRENDRTPIIPIEDSLF